MMKKLVNGGISGCCLIGSDYADLYFAGFSGTEEDDRCLRV